MLQNVGRIVDRSRACLSRYPKCYQVVIFFWVAKELEGTLVKLIELGRRWSLDWSLLFDAIHLLSLREALPLSSPKLILYLQVAFYL